MNAKSTLTDSLSPDVFDFIEQHSALPVHIEKVTLQFPPLSAIILEGNMKKSGGFDVSFPFLKRLGQFALLDRGLLKLYNNNIEMHGVFDLINNLSSLRKAADIETIWLEFDCSHFTTDKMIAPGVFFNFDMNCVSESICQSIEIITQKEMSESIRNRLLNSLAVLSDKSGDIGIFLGRRSTPFVRLSIILSYQDLIHCAGRLNVLIEDDLITAIQDLKHLICLDDIRLNIDVGNDRNGNSSLEIKTYDYGKYVEIFDYLVRFNWCDSQLTNKILNWPNYEDTAHIVSDVLTTYVPFTKPSFSFRSIHHIKIQLKNNEKDSKFYLSEEYAW